MANKRYFQWIDGEDFGNVEVLDSIRFEQGEYFFDFESGESMNMRFIAAQTNDPTQLEGKALVEIYDIYDKWQVKEIKTKMQTVQSENGEVTVEVPTLDDIRNGNDMGGGNMSIEHSSIGSKRYIAPKFRGPFKPLPDPSDYIKNEEVKQIVVDEKIEEIKNEVKSANTIETPIVEQNVKTETSNTKSINAPTLSTNNTDPVYILVNSAAKEEKSVDLTLKLNLPSKDLYKIVALQFENGKEKFMECITNILSESLTSKDILNTLRDSIIAAYDE